MPIAVIVDWYGPYDSLPLFKAEMQNWPRGCKGLYMGVQRGNIVGYIGLTTSPATRFNTHPKLTHPDNIRFFCGEIVSQGVGGRRATKCKTDLKIAEHALIRRVRPKLNAHLVDRDFDDCFVIYSRFFKRMDYETPINPLPKFPSVIAYNSYSDEWAA